MAEFGSGKWRRKYRVERSSEWESDEGTVLGQCYDTSPNYGVHGYFRGDSLVSSSSLERKERLRCGNVSLICCFEKRKGGLDSLK